MIQHPNHMHLVSQAVNHEEGYQMLCSHQPLIESVQATIVEALTPHETSEHQADTLASLLFVMVLYWARNTQENAVSIPLSSSSIKILWKI